MSTTAPDNVRAIFKAYDVRGVVPDQIDEHLARRTGAAFVRVTGADTVVVGHDMRPSSPALAGAFAAGAADAGADIVMIGLASTDQLYFASGHLGHPGAMFTASHNPAQYNGIKLCRAGAQPIGADTGLAEIRDLVSEDEPPPAAGPGRISRRDLLDAYAAHLLSLAPVAGRRLKVVVDAATDETVASIKADVQLGPGRVRVAVVTIRIDLELDTVSTTQDVAVAVAFLVTEIVEFAMLNPPLEPIPTFTAADASPMPAGQFVEVVVPLYYEGHAYRAGSRIRVTIAAPNGTQPIWSFSQTVPNPSGNVSIAFSTSMPSSVVCTPNFAPSRAPSASSAACSSAFVGMQPRCRQVPPTLSFSMRATVRPSSLARNAAA